MHSLKHTSVIKNIIKLTLKISVFNLITYIFLGGKLSLAKLFCKSASINIMNIE